VTPATVDEAAVGAFAQRVLADGTASITMLMAALGDRLGLFRALAEGGPATPAQLAAPRGSRRAVRPRMVGGARGRRLP